MTIAPLFDQLVKGDRMTFSQTTLNEFCQKWQITEVCVFGSALRDDFHRDKSDLDLLVTFSNSAPWSLFDLVAIS